MDDKAAGREDVTAAEHRLRMVNSQLRTSDVSDNAVLAAFLTVPREAFVAPAFAGLAYLDQDAPAAGGSQRRLVAPRTLGRLIQAAEVKPGDRALEVGGGSGYGSALLAALGADVTLLETEENATAAERALGGESRIAIVRGALDKGAPDHGPFDVILINGAFEVTPSILLEQLAERGRLVGLDAREGTPRGVLIRKAGRSVSERALFDAFADVLPGFARLPAFAF